MPSAALLCILAGAIGLTCGTPWPEKTGESACPEYETEIRPVLAAKCGDCHGSTRKEGDYQVGDYLSTVSRRRDGYPRVGGGDPGSLLLAAARGELPQHTAVDAATLTLLTDWNVRCRAAATDSDWHATGWTTPTDAERSHGMALRATGYTLDECKLCHGDDLRGGKSQKSCSTCHTEGVNACNTCHGDASSPAPPRDLEGRRSTRAIGVGAHRQHVTSGPLHKAYGCEVCHKLPAQPEEEGHYRKAGGVDQAPAEVVLKPALGAEAAWDRAAGTCASTFCHAPSRGDTAATNQRPTWTKVGYAQGACGTCHGLPPSGHADTRCEVCHDGFTATTVDPEVHANLKVDLRGEGTDCAACHSAPGDATFSDLYGRSDPALETVGLHDIHLTGQRFRAPLSCGDCHAVPAELRSAGHIDSAAPAEVFTSTSSLGRKDEAVASYDAARGSCRAVYCHGGGVNAALDRSPGVLRELPWLGATSRVTCGSCHGLPPADGTADHTGATLATCVNCHADTVNTVGTLKMNRDPMTGRVSTTHLDGVVTRN